MIGRRGVWDNRPLTPPYRLVGPARSLAFSGSPGPYIEWVSSNLAKGTFMARRKDARGHGRWWVSTGLLILVVLSAGPAEAAVGHDPDAAEILEKAAAAYQGGSGFCANFEQRRVVALMDREATSRGTLCSAGPARFRVAFSEPDGDRVVADGDDLWVYYPSVDPGQVLRSDLADGSGAWGASVAYPSGLMEPEDAQLLGRETVRGRKAWVVELGPNQDAGLERLRLWIDDGAWLVRRVELEEENGSLRELSFRGIETEPDLSPDTFRFEPPSGAQVIERGACAAGCR